MYRFIRQLDTDAQRGDMKRCCLFSKKVVWLCSEHQKFSRSFLADDDVDTDDIFLGELETENDTNLAYPSTENDNNRTTSVPGPSMYNDYKRLPTASSPTEVSGILSISD